jgi:AcrR family transcriptional regulator
MSSRMERKKEERKDTILNAAESLITEHGYKSMTMDQVAGKADVAKGTLYLYFKNKGTLCAAVNARINKELNGFIKEKMDHYHSGSEKILASGAAVIDFSHKKPLKWKASTELYQMKYQDQDDPNVQESIQQANKTVQMLAAAYLQGKKEGSILTDIDPVATAIYNRMAISNAFTPTSEQKLLLELNDISQEHYLSVSWNLINRSTHVKSSIREESEVPIQERRTPEEIGKEIKEIVESMELPTENALDIFNAWKIFCEITMGNVKYEILESDEDHVLFQVTDCPIFNSIQESDAPKYELAEGCRNFSAVVVEKLNPKYNQKFKKMKCDGEDCCEGLIELKKLGTP